MTEREPCRRGGEASTHHLQQTGGMPAVVGGDAPVGAERLPECLEFLWGWRVDVPRGRVAVAHRQVSDGPNIHSSKAKHQKEICRPFADPSH